MSESELGSLLQAAGVETIAVESKDMQGWNSYDHVFRDVIETVQPDRSIEVGVWKGTAVINMAKLTRDLGPALRGARDRHVVGIAGTHPAQGRRQALRLS